MIRIITAMTAPTMKYHNILLAQMPPQLYGVDVGLSPVGNSGIEGDGEIELVGKVPKGMYWELSDNP